MRKEREREMRLSNSHYWHIGLAYLISDDEQAAVGIVLDAGRRLEHLMTEVEVKVERAVTVVI